MALIDVEDDVWRAQNPSAAELSPRNQRWLWLAVLGALLLAVAPPLLNRVGAFRPQLSSADFGWQGDFVYPSGHTEYAMAGQAPSSYVRATAGFINTGWSTLRILSVSVSGPGFRFDHATARPIGADGSDSSDPGWPAGREPLAVLAPDRGALVSLYFQITDCHAVTAAPRGITVRVDSWRGTQEVTVALPVIRHTQGGWSVTDPRDPGGINPIRYLADATCQVDMGA